MARGFQFGLLTLLVWAAMATSAGAVLVSVRTNAPVRFLLSLFLLAVFVWVAIRQTKNPANWMLGFLGLFFLWPLMLLPVALLLAAVGMIDMD